MIEYVGHLSIAGVVRMKSIPQIRISHTRVLVHDPDGRFGFVESLSPRYQLLIKGNGGGVLVCVVSHHGNNLCDLYACQHNQTRFSLVTTMIFRAGQSTNDNFHPWVRGPDRREDRGECTDDILN